MVMVNIRRIFGVLLIILSLIVVAQRRNSDEDKNQIKPPWTFFKQYAGTYWHGSSFIELYPQINMLGAPPKWYIDDKGREVYDVCGKLKQTMGKLTELPLNKQQYNDKEFLGCFVKNTFDYHKQVFDLLKEKTDMDFLDIYSYSSENEISLCYRIKNKKLILGLALNCWSPEELDPKLNVENPEKYLLFVDSMSGDERGIFKLITAYHLKYRNTIQHQSEVFVRFTYCFNPFLDKEKAWKKIVQPEKIIEFSENFKDFEIQNGV